ncbi:MAG: hypothetical protein HY577_00135 [Candidatus Nealsonbacteria bacterium]|nr:hypothetical protein [Candidatus Nealsonbacteria bacterium]
MFGPIFVIIAFFICLALGYIVCRFGGQCAQMEFGMTAMIGVLIFIIIILFLQRYTVSP